MLIKSSHYPGELVACKRGSPLILGIKETPVHTLKRTSSSLISDLRDIRKRPAGEAFEAFVASDASAVVEHTKRYPRRPPASSCIDSATSPAHCVPSLSFFIDSAGTPAHCVPPFSFCIHSAGSPAHFVPPCSFCIDSAGYPAHLVAYALSMQSRFSACSHACAVAYSPQCCS